MNMIKNYDDIYVLLERVETLDFQKARERARKKKLKMKQQRILSALLIIVGAITIPLCGDITPFIFIILLSISVMLP